MLKKLKVDDIFYFDKYGGIFMLFNSLSFLLFILFTLFINYIQNINELNLNYEEDFFVSGHLTSKGSDKLSLNFCNYLEVWI